MSELSQLFAEDWAWEMNDNPEYASQAGFRGGPGLQDVSPAGYAVRREHSSHMLARLQALDSAAFSPDEAIFAQMFNQTHADIVEGM